MAYFNFTLDDDIEEIKLQKEKIDKTSGEEDVILWFNEYLLPKMKDFKELSDDEVNIFNNNYDLFKPYFVIVQNYDELLKLINAGIYRNTAANLNFINISNVINLNRLFYYTDFYGDISRWDTSNVKSMSHMFEKSDFNGDISDWDVSNCLNFESMFANSQFNQDLSKWEIKNIAYTKMDYMFQNTKYNHNLSSWNLSNILRNEKEHMFYNCDIPDEFLPRGF